MMKRPPETPEFQAISKAIIHADAEAKAGRFSAMIREVADLDTLTWFAMQRASMAVGDGPGQPPAAALWLDGFMAGAAFRKTSPS
jgi:hypothetical protein